ncbi:MAG: hypothetical protein SGPRY_000212 [Prymnesium sp.]
MSSHSLGSKTEVGDAFPNVAVHVGFAGLDPNNVKMSGDLAAKGKTLHPFLHLWIPCHQIPGLMKAEKDGSLKEAGVDKVFIFSANDGAVMTAWKEAQGIPADSIIEFVADTQSSLTVALDIVLTTHPGPAAVLGAHTIRCKRTCIVVVDGTIKVIQIAEAMDDPAGDSKPDATLIENMLPAIKSA